MAGAELRPLQEGGGAERVGDRLDLLGLVADHDEGGKTKGLGGAQHVGQQRQPAGFMQDLGALGLQARPFTRRQHHGRRVGRHLASPRRHHYTNTDGSHKPQLFPGEGER
jgi:hypothetical protein